MYLNLIQIAESFGVSEGVVEEWIRSDGMPCTPDRDRLLFDRAQVAQWAAERGMATRVGFLAPETPGFSPPLRLGPLLRAGGVWRDAFAAELPVIFERIVTALPGATPAVRRLLGQRIRAIDGVTMAPVGDGFALPHPSARITLGRDSGTVALILLRDDLVPDEPHPDELPVKRLFFFISPSPRGHFDILAGLSRSLTHGNLRDLVKSGADDDAIFKAMEATDAAMGKKA
ncbi:MAG TPA: PTS sugar transporter subunit IIA [Opitutales bacterium]|nr:PTS sugar transporter subunit IIA [Opitutales bacterium]